MTMWQSDLKPFPMRTPRKTINKRLLITTLGNVLRDMQSWNQLTWARDMGECGTAFCFAGHAYVERFRPNNHAIQSLFDWDDLGQVQQASQTIFRNVHGDQMYISDAAKMVLGLNFRESDVLFSVDNSTFRVLAYIAGAIWMGEQGTWDQFIEAIEADAPRHTLDEDAVWYLDQFIEFTRQSIDDAQNGDLIRTVNRVDWMMEERYGYDYSWSKRRYPLFAAKY